MSRKQKLFSRKKALSIGGAIALLALLVGIWKVPQWQANSVPSITSKERAELENANRGTFLQALGGLFFLVTAYFTWRNLQVAEDKQVTERFSKAIEQLGSDKLEVRLGGIYSLERIARDSERDHWTIMEVLVSFVKARSPKSQVIDQTEQAVMADVQAAITVIGRRDYIKDPQGKKIDLWRTNLTKADFTEAKLAGADFYEATLQSAGLRESDLTRARFISANLSGATFKQAKLVEALLEGANLRSVNLSGADLRGADLHAADLEGADLRGANLIGVTRLTQKQISKAIVDDTTKIPEKMSENLW